MDAPVMDVRNTPHIREFWGKRKFQKARNAEEKTLFVLGNISRTPLRIYRLTQLRRNLVCNTNLVTMHTPLRISRELY